MSTGVAATWNAEGNQNAGNWSQYAVSTAVPYNGQFSVGVSPVASTSATPTSTTTPYAWQPPAHWKVDPAQAQTQAYAQVQQQQQAQVQRPALPVYVKKAPKAKGRTKEEEEIIAETAARFAARIKQDQEAVLNPDADTPFEDEADVIKRLLPYHIFQQPKEDLELLAYGKGKGKAKECDLKAELEDAKFAIECHKRQERLRARWRRIKIRQGERASPDTQAYVLAQAVLDTDRQETAALSTELRTARSELERIQREQRAAQNAAPRVTQFTVAPTPPVSTLQPQPQPQTQYYRPYPYAYAQQPYGNPAAGSTTLTFPATPVQPSPAYMYQPGSAIPVQLPVASLPALHQLGIVPVPASLLPLDGQPQAPAILRGSSANGTMLSLEINVSLLQSAQMSGLAVILNSLVARNTSQAATAAAATATATTPTTPYGSGYAPTNPPGHTVNPS